MQIVASLIEDKARIQMRNYRTWTVHLYVNTSHPDFGGMDIINRMFPSRNVSWPRENLAWIRIAKEDQVKRLFEETLPYFTSKYMITVAKSILEYMELTDGDDVDKGVTLVFRAFDALNQLYDSRK